MIKTMSRMSDSEGNPVKVKSNLDQAILQEDLSADSISFSEDSFDIFATDYSALHRQALKEAYKELREEEESEDVPVSSSVGTDKQSNPNEFDCIEVVSCVVSSTNINDLSIVDSNDCILLDSPVQLKKSDRGNDKENSRRSSRLKRKCQEKSAKAKKEKPKRVKKARTMNKELEAISKQISENNKLCDQHNQSDVMVLSEDDNDDDFNREIRLNINWGSKLLHIPIRQLQPFSEVYRLLGEQHCVSPSRVMLSHNHQLISPTQCPHDFALTLADFIEGGILEEEVDEGSSSRGAGVSSQPGATATHGSIPLKVQNSNHKATVTIHISKTDKMKILMHRYAELQKAKLEDLKFFFDGEILNPSATPVSLDLDGDECIDVYIR